MTSPTPLLFDSYYHIYNRGVNKEDIFKESRNYDYFIQLMQKYIRPVADIYAYCLLLNHFHLLIRTHPESEGAPQDGGHSPSLQFSKFFNAYAKSINKAYGRSGSLFQHPYGRVLIQDTNYFYRVLRYIHQNPQKHGLAPDFRKWKYSSYNEYLGDQQDLNHQLVVLDWFGDPKQYIEFHQIVDRYLDADPKGLQDP
jgi:putative transposase